MRKKVSLLDGIVMLLCTIFLLFLINRNETHAVIDNTNMDSLHMQPVIKMKFGIPVDSFSIERGNIKRNQHLASIFSLYNVSHRAIENIIKNGKEVFDFRKVKAGNKYSIYTSKDTLHTLHYFVYEHSLAEYYVFDFSDSAYITKWEKHVDTVKNVAHGIVESCLWNTMVEKKINPLMANELSEIYAWVIDFFGLQQGDSFNVIYDELYVDTISLGIHKIHAAYFKHMSRDFYAIPFKQDSASTEDFFDTEGNSLRRAFLKAPLRYSRISSGFSHNRFHPILRIYRPHHGVDYAAPKGTPVHAIGDGVVIKKGYYGGAGNMIKIRHNSVYTTAYLHFSGFVKGIHVGKFVKQGELIGYVGSTGLSTGPHLDFRFYKNGYAVNPLKVEAPPVEPVREERREAFDSVKVLVLSALRNK